MACENEYEENMENLRKLLYINNIVSFRIEQLNCSAGSSSGDNYMSVVKRIKVAGHECVKTTTTNYIKNADSTSLGNDLCQCSQSGEVPSRISNQLTLILKRQIPSISRRRLYRCDEAFNNEINAYKHVVPLLTRYSTDNFFPKCYFAGTDKYGEIIVLEDLKQHGFCMHNRLTGLDLTYCKLVMEQLAKLHAASIAAKHMENEIFHEKCQKLRDIVYNEEAEEFYRTIVENSVEEALNSLRQSNVDGCLTEPIHLIEQLHSKLFNHIQYCVCNAKDSLSVVCHGDLWVNNIMFASSISSSSSSSTTTTTTASSMSTTTTTTSSTSTKTLVMPNVCNCITNTTSTIHNNNNNYTTLTSSIASKKSATMTTTTSTTNSSHNNNNETKVRFIDLQAMRYTTPVFDILHFIYTSTQRALRDASTTTLLETYCLALAAELEIKFPTAAFATKLNTLRDTYSLSNITAEYYEHVLYGLVISMWILPAVTFDPQHIPNLDVISEINTNSKDIKCTSMLTPEFHMRIKDVALEFYQNGYLDIMSADETPIIVRPMRKRKCN